MSLFDKLNKIVALIFFSFFISCPSQSDSSGTTKPEDPSKKGNFALPTSQQPGPLMGLGQNVIDKNQIQTFLFADDFIGVKKHAADLTPSLLYGITNDLSVFFQFPTAISFRDGMTRSSGFEDMSLQLEYAYINNKKSTYVDQATLIANVSLPTGSAKKQPNTGLGSPAFLLGGTFSRMYSDWFAFTSPGVILTTSHHRTKFGNQFLYQAGFGRNILSITSEWILAWMIEATGQYTQKDKIMGVTEQNSGGNVIYVTPSLWISSRHIILQLGAGVAASQNLFGKQKKNKYLIVANLGWTF
jgi:hypothetical protein